jgi:hypothetical protein
MNEEIVQPTAPVETQPAQETNDRETNWKLARQRQHELERQNYELQQALAAKSAPVEDDDNISIADDGLAEGKHIKKIEKRRARDTESLYKKIEQLENKLSEQALKNKHRDFDDIVTTENLQKLAEKKPALYRSIIANKDLADRGEVAHEAISTWILKPNVFQVEERKIEENRVKPRSAATVAPAANNNPLTRYQEGGRISLSEDDKAAVRARAAKLRQTY